MLCRCRRVSGGENMNERTIFLAALDRTDPAKRAAYLDEACAGDAGLRSRVEELLGWHEQAGSFLAVPAVEQMPAEHITPSLTEETLPRTERDDDLLALLDPPEKPGQLGRLKHYEVVEVVGRGG